MRKLAGFVLGRSNLYYDKRAKTLKEALLNPAARALIEDVRESAIIWFLNQWISFDVDILPRWVCKDGEPVKVESWLNFYVDKWIYKLYESQGYYETKGVIRAEKPLFDFPFNPAVLGLGLKEYKNDEMILSYDGDNLNDFVLRLADVPTLVQLQLENDLLSRIVMGARERIKEKNELEFNGFKVEPVGNRDYTQIVFSFGNSIEVRAAVKRPPLTEVCETLGFYYL